jgi:hypothetical protein
MDLFWSLAQELSLHPETSMTDGYYLHVPTLLRNKFSLKNAWLQYFMGAGGSGVG